MSISRTVSEIFSVKKWRDLEILVRGHWRSFKLVPYGSLGAVSYSPSNGFHSNYGCILHHFRDEARYWSKIVIFIPPLHSMPLLGGPSQSIATSLGMEKLEWSGYPIVQKGWGYL